jgi:hypothetical protein
MKFRKCEALMMLSGVCSLSNVFFFNTLVGIGLLLFSILLTLVMILNCLMDGYGQDGT